MSDRCKSDWVDASLYPYTSHWFQTNAGLMHYISEGAGDPIVFVHGNPSWSFEYRDLIATLSKQHRCIAADHIGFGLSEKPQPWSYLPQDHAHNLEQLITHLDLENITLVVGDWGGPIGLSYAIRHPKNIKAIVVTNTWLWSVQQDWYYQMFSRVMGGRFGRWLIETHNFFAQTIVRMAYGDKSKLTPEIHKHYLMPFDDRKNRVGSVVLPSQILGASEWLDGMWAQRAVLNNKPMLIAWGAKDIAFRKKELKTWITAFPNARAIAFENAGHFVAEEHPQELGKAIADLLKTNS